MRWNEIKSKLMMEEKNYNYFKLK